MTPIRQIVEQHNARAAAAIMERGRVHLGWSYAQTMASLARIASREGFQLDPAAWDELVREGEL